MSDPYLNPEKSDGPRLLRIEARNAQTPIERKPEWIKTKLKTGPEYTEIMGLVKSGISALGAAIFVRLILASHFRLIEMSLDAWLNQSPPCNLSTQR